MLTENELYNLLAAGTKVEDIQAMLKSASIRVEEDKRKRKREEDARKLAARVGLDAANVVRNHLTAGCVTAADVLAVVKSYLLAKFPTFDKDFLDTFIAEADVDDFLNEFKEVADKCVSLLGMAGLKPSDAEVKKIVKQCKNEPVKDVDISSIFEMDEEPVKTKTKVIYNINPDTDKTTLENFIKSIMKD